MDNWIFLRATTNYPFGFTAGNTKVEFMAKGLNENGCKTLVINSCDNCDCKEDIQGKTEDGIEYVTYNSSTNFKTLKSFIKTYKILKERKSERNFVVISTSRAYVMFTDIIISKMLGYKTLFLFHEWRSAHKMQSFLHKIDAYLKDRILPHFFDAYLPISHFLLDKCNNYSTKKKSLIVPVIADFSEDLQKIEVEEKFSYCCHVWFLMRHPYILDTFEKLHNKHNSAKLILILSGNDKDIELFKISNKDKACFYNVEIKSKVPYEELDKIYKSSIALIIPLTPNSIADMARFSQKIAEYVATGRPIITNNVGEIPYYFKDKESAYIADYSVEGFYNTMEHILLNKEEATNVGIMGYNVGKNHFNYKVSMKELAEFAKTI